jgi:predicted nucleic acid-binding protein
MDEHEEKPIKVVVCDAGPLIHLDELGYLDLLCDFQRVLVPNQVWAEVNRHRPSALTHQGVVLHRVTTNPVFSPELDGMARMFSLDAGELEALQIARDAQADLLLSDDTAARLAAMSLAIPVHGTIGILLRSIRRGHRPAPEIVATLRNLPTASTLHIKRSLLDEIIRKVEAIQ